MSDTPTEPEQPHEVVVIGAGPAGLTAAFQLHKYGVSPTILEADDTVGGISRTAERDGWRFDIGGHRFFTKVKEVEAFWHEILPDEDFMLRPRMSRIFYEGKYYDYPLKIPNVLRNLGLWEAFLCVASYLSVRIRPPKDQNTLEGWIRCRDFGIFRAPCNRRIGSKPSHRQGFGVHGNGAGASAHHNTFGAQPIDKLHRQRRRHCEAAGRVRALT